MPLTVKTCGAVLLAGGRSRRMGCSKALLPWNGETLLSSLSRRLSLFEEVLLSANDPSLGEGLSLRLVPDLLPDRGPLAGLYSALRATEKEAVFCLPCDLPCFSASLAERMLERFPEGAEAFLCRDSVGRIHPLCGIYTQKAAPHIARQLERGEKRVMDLLPHLKWASFDLPPGFPDRVLFNMNTPEDLWLLAERGWKGENDDG